jgi:hypothetical protein
MASVAPPSCSPRGIGGDRSGGPAAGSRTEWKSLIVAVDEERREDKLQHFRKLGTDAATKSQLHAAVACLAIVGTAPLSRHAVAQKMTAVELPLDE